MVRSVEVKRNLAMAETNTLSRVGSPPWRKPPVKPVLFPRSVRHPLVILAVCVLPQIVLLLINFQAWQLGSGEMMESHRSVAWQILGAELLSLACGTGLFAWLAISRQSFTRLQGLIPLAGSLVFLATVFVLADQAIPPAVADWMLPLDQWLVKQFALVMPAALFGALRLLCPDQETEADRTESLARAIAISLVLFGGCLGFLFLVGPIFSGVFASDVGQMFITSAFMGLSTLAAAALLRVSISMYVWARVSSPGYLAAFTFCVALMGPLLGLTLNSAIPFPADFQSTAIYVVALINGLVLVLPNFSHPLAHRIIWLAQCVLFPFTVYFFAVFLPFLLMGPLALLFLGLGVFVYVPSLLFLLHGYRIIDGYRAEVRDGRKWVPVVLGVAAVLVWPAAYTLQARMDRGSLYRALDYLQYPDYAENARFEGSLPALHSSLEHLRDFKEGLYLPFLSDYYNWLAFDSLVLPQAKMDALNTAFFGRPLGKSTRRATFSGEFGMGRRGARNMTEALGGVQGQRPPADARLDTVKTSVRTEQGVTRASTVMTVRNPTQQATEFLTTIQVPPGVMISGMWLTIGAERVPGRIFEKKSAMWVYQKITEVRPVPRDPAILRYTGPNTAELRVYPVEPTAPRVVEVEFLYPDGLNPAIDLGGHGRLDFAPAPAAAATIGVSEDGKFVVAIPASSAAPVVEREPYLHFLVDASKDSLLSDTARLRSAINRAANQFPKISRARVTFVNFETTDFLGGKMVSLEEILKAPDAELKPAAQGGLLAFRAIKEILWKHHLALASLEESALKQFPQIVLLRGSDAPLPPDETANLAEFARLLPDLPGYWTLNSGARTPAQFSPLDLAVHRSQRLPVHIFQVGGARFASEAGRPASFLSLSAANGPVDRIEAWDGTTGAFVALDAKVERPASPAYGRAIVSWSLEMARFFEPWRHKAGDLGRLLALCRETGVLVPSAAYMVVEDTAQWKMLERTEKKAMKGHEALALAEPAVPEPGTVLLVVAGVVFLLAFQRRVRRPDVVR